MTTTHRCLCNSSYINTHGWKEFPNTKTEQTSISLPFFPDLIIAAPIIAVIFIIALSIYRVCFHHSNKVTLVFPCKERQRKRGRKKRERARSQGGISWREGVLLPGSRFEVKEATTTGALHFSCPLALSGLPPPRQTFDSSSGSRYCP